MKITTETGLQRVLQAGDIACFKGGTWATWQVDDYVRKIAFPRRPFPAPLAFLYKMRRLLKSKFRKSPPASRPIV